MKPAACKAKPQVVFLIGPTAAGKTEIAMDVAKKFPVDIISVDAAQVYRGMDIGTAKPPPDVLADTPHKLIDICEPWERYSAGRFRKDALHEMQVTIENGRIPLLVGGTMFYFKILESGLSNLPQREDAVRAQLLKQAEKFGWPYLHAMLKRIDPQSASKVSVNDRHRIQRLLEVYMIEKHSPSAVMQIRPANPLAYPIVKIAVVCGGRDKLRSAIELRFRTMLENGFLVEAERHYCSPKFDESLPAMRLVGYKQAWRYFDGSIGYDQMVKSSIQATSEIAKRQLTWIRNTAGVIWTDRSITATSDNVCNILDSILHN